MLTKNRGDAGYRRRTVILCKRSLPKYVDMTLKLLTLVPPALMTFYLRHVHGSKRGRTASYVQNRIRIGRAPDNDICMDPERDEEVSAHHAVLFRDGERFIIEDLESTNGTFLNGRRVIEPAVVSDGDELEFAAGGPRVVFSTKSFQNAEALRATVAVSPLTNITGELPGKGRIGARTAMFMRDLYDNSAQTIKRLRFAILAVAVLFGFVATGLVIGNYKQRTQIVDLAQRADEMYAAKASLEESRLALIKEGQELQAKVERQAAELERLDRLIKKLAGVGLDTSVNDKGDVSVSLPNVNFHFNDATLTEEGLEKVRYIASLLGPENADRNVMIQGHASLEPGGNEARNDELAKERTDTVASAFIASGINANRIQTQSFGSSRPLATNETEEGRRKNRRVEVILASPSVPASAPHHPKQPPSTNVRRTKARATVQSTQPVVKAPADSPNANTRRFSNVEDIKVEVPVDEILDSVFEK